MRIGNINGEGRALFSLESSLQAPTTPSISFAGDENTGIYQPTTSPDNIAIATGGAQRLLITNSGLLTVDGGGTDTGYAVLVVAENDIPNKKYVDDAITTGASFPLGDLSNVTDSGVSGHFLIANSATTWISQDQAAQITSLGLDSGGANDIWVDVAGDTMDSGANITFSGGGTVTGLVAATVGATDAASKAYVDAAVSGLGWTGAIADPDLVGISADTPAGAVLGTGYIAYLAGAGLNTPTGDWLTDISGVVEYDYVYLKLDGTWIIVGNIASASGVVEVRFGVAFEHGTALSVFTSINVDDSDLVEYIGGPTGDPTAITSWSHPQGHAGDPAHNFTGVDVTVSTKTFKISGDHTLDFFANNRITITGTTAADAEYTIASVTFATPDTLVVVDETVAGANQTVAFTATSEIYGGTTTLVNATNSQHNGHTYSYNEADNVWNEVSGPGSIGAGDGLSYSGSTLNVNFGAGVALESDDVRASIGASVGLILSTDAAPAVSAPTDAASKIRVITDGSTIGFTTGALYVPNGGITETQLNTSVAGAGLAGGGGTALSVGITTNGGIAIVTDELQLDISDLAVVTTVALSDTLAVDQGAAPNKKATFTDMVEDLGIPNNISTTGLIINNAGAYSTVSMAANGAGALAGLVVADPTGAAGNPTYGLDINNVANGGADLDATDQFILYDGTNNVSMTGQEMANGLSGLLSLDNTRITDGDTGTAETFIDTDVGGATANTITSQVGAGTTHSASAPLTMSADAGIAILSSTASATNSAGAPITVTGGVGDGNGAGGLVDLEGGIGGATGNGGALNLSGGASGAAGDGGAATITAGASPTLGTGGVASLTGGASSTSGAGGASAVTGGASINAAGGAATVTGGASTSGAGGASSLIGGASATGAGGSANVLGGDATAGTAAGGDVTIQAGFSTGGTDGTINFLGVDGSTPAVLRIHDDATVGNEFIGFTTGAITSSITYTLPEAPALTGYVLASTTAGVMSWVDAASAGANAFGTITTDAGVDAVALTNGDSIAITGATDGGIETTGAATPSMTIALKINDLGTTGGGTIVLGDSLAVFDTSEGITAAATVQYTFTDMVQDLDIPNGISAVGLVVRTGTNTYASRSIAVDGAGSLEGLIVANATGASANPTIGLNITGMTTAAVDMDATDKFVVFDGSNNVSMNGQDIADGVKTLLSLDNTIITDAAGTFIDTDATASTITSGVTAVGNFAAGTPITLSAASTLITSSDGSGTGNPGAPISITSGAGTTTGAGGSLSLSAGSGGGSGIGGSVSITSGDGATTGDAGDINLTAADGGSTSGAAGSINLITNASDGTGADGFVAIKAGAAGFVPTLRFQEDSTNGTDYIGMQAPASVGTSITYTLPVAPGSSGFVLASTTGGVMSWVNPIGSGAFAYGVVNGDTGTANAASGNDTISLIGATSGGIVTVGGDAPDQITFAMDINDLAVGSANILAVSDTFAVYDGATRKYTFTDMVEDLEIPNAVGTTVGFITLDGTDSYATHTLSAAAAGAADGISVSAGGTNGAADVTFGLDITGTPALGAGAAGNLVADDEFIVYSPTTGGGANETITGQQVADGVASLISLDTTKIVDADGDTWIDVDVGDADTDKIETQVFATATHATGTPLTMSAAGGSLITSSAGLSGNAGGVISLTTGAGEGVGAGGALSATGGAGGATGAGGAITLIAGAGGATSGAGGDVTITGGANGGSGTGGDVTITGGGGNLTKAGSASLCGGDGVGVDGGDVTICPGDSNTAAGGSIILQPGSGATDGTISVSAGSSATEIRFYDVAADNYVGFRAADVLSVDTSFIWPTADGSASQVMITDGSGNLSFAAPGAGLTAGEAIDITGSTISLDINGLTQTPIATADEIVFWDVTATAAHKKTTISAFITNLDIVTTSGITNGILVKTADDTYLGRTITESVAAGFQGVDVINGNGVSGNPTIGLDFSNLVDGAGNVSQADQIIVHDGTNNLEHTVAELNGGLRLDGLADVVADSVNDTAGEMLVADGTDSYDAKAIQYIRTFTSTSSLVVTHALGQKWCTVQVYVSDALVIPASVTLDSATQCTITFAVATAGTVVVMGVPGTPVN